MSDKRSADLGVKLAEHMTDKQSADLGAKLMQNACFRTTCRTG